MKEVCSFRQGTQGRDVHVLSAWTAMASPPAALISSTVSSAASLERVTDVVDTTFCPAFPRSRAMDFPKPRDDPVTRMTLASSATILSEDEDRGVKANLLAGAKADEATAERRTKAVDKSFMVDLL